MGKYDDIINLPHHVSNKHPQMSMYQRAAQFAPFAALTGHGAAINETARRTDSEIELSEQERQNLNRNLNIILETIKSYPSVTITYFINDEHKSGGRYSTIKDNIKKYDEYSGTLHLECGLEIQISHIADIKSELCER